MAMTYVVDMNARDLVLTPEEYKLYIVDADENYFDTMAALRGQDENP